MNFKGLRSMYKRNEFVSFSISVLLIIVLVSFSPYFLDMANLDSLQTAIAPAGIIAIGMMVLLITGMFDLSVGSIMSISGVVTAMLLDGGMPVIPSILIGILAGAVIGLINGFLVAHAKINHLIATIGMMYMIKGISEILLVGEGREGYRNFPEQFIQMGTGKFLGIYYMFWIMLILVVLAQLFVLFTPTGRKLYYIGGNPEAAGLMGFNVKKIKMLAFVLSGSLSAVAGILSTARYEMANRYMGQGMHMSIIISCIIGGSSLAGGKGSVVGAIFGVIFSSLLSNYFNLFEVKPQWQNVVIGIILVIVVISDGYLSLRKQRELGRI
ncbi:MAG TPA: ABC transporter permease [Candidatus Udaeobacter sp.]|nr:ABC transporter permease [Candidatus Udaeobacter sp.]